MSVRPHQVADEAAKFTLRSFFSGAEATAEPAPQEPRVAETPALFLEPTAPRQLSFDLGGATRPGIGAHASTGAGLKFTLPAMKTARPVAGAGSTDGGKMLQAGYITGGFANNNDPEIMRLNGIVDDLQERLKRSTERIGNAEQSVARGNAALQTERATSHARIIALAAEVKNAQQRETAVRVELAAVPKLSDMDAAKFEMQAKGAVELQASYDKEVQRVEELEIAMAEATGKHALLVDENVALCAQLETAKAELATTQELATAATTDEALKAENETLRTQLETTSAALATAAPVDEALKIENETLKTQLEAATGAKELATAPTELVAELKTQLATATEELADAHEAANTMAMDHRMYDALVFENTELRDQVETMIRAQPMDDQDHEEALMSLGAALEEARQQIVTQEALVTAEKLRNHEADGLIKTLDAKLASVREGTACCPQTSVEDVPPAVAAEFEQYAMLKQHAEHAASLVRCAGPDAAEWMKEDADFLHAKAQRCYHTMKYGNSDDSQTTCFDTPCRPHTVDLATVRSNMATKLNVNSYRNGVACTSQDDCDVDFHEIPVATGRAVSARHKTADVGLKMRTDKYVSAVQDDIKAKLMVESKRWQEIATGVRV